VDSEISLAVGFHMNAVIIKPESGDSISVIFKDGYDNSHGVVLFGWNLAIGMPIQLQRSYKVRSNCWTKSAN